MPTILCEIDPCDSCSVTNKYYYANAQILKQDNAKGSFYYVHDRLGSVRLLVNDIGDVNNSYTYNSFGEDFASECSESVENNFKYTGQWYDSEIGHYYLRARMYDPALMRFTSRDPVVGKQQEPLMLHKYLYCENNPINRFDRSGKVYEELLQIDEAVYARNQAYGSICYGIETGNEKFFNLGLALIDVSIMLARSVPDMLSDDIALAVALTLGGPIGSAISSGLNIFELELYAALRQGDYWETVVRTNDELQTGISGNELLEYREWFGGY